MTIFAAFSLSAVLRKSSSATMSLRQIVAALNDRGIADGARWEMGRDAGLGKPPSE
jgi:hypothetical protein